MDCKRKVEEDTSKSMLWEEGGILKNCGKKNEKNTRRKAAQR
jgi:hypothetical protein